MRMNIIISPCTVLTIYFLEYIVWHLLYIQTKTILINFNMLIINEFIDASSTSGINKKVQNIKPLL